MSKPTISVFGVGKLGAPMVACFASKGFRVFAVDTDSQTRKLLEDGNPPIFEPGLRELWQSSQKNIVVTGDADYAVENSSVSFVLVPTPSEANGSFGLRYVQLACNSIGRAIAVKNEFHTVVLTSTVMPGSTDREVRTTLERSSGKKCSIDFGLCYSPEFVALGSVIRDFLHPDFLLIGESDTRSGDILADVYSGVCENKPQVARMNFVNAELAKLSVNTFVTTKITFANMLARMCEKLPGANVDAVSSALAMDSRIGGKYLKGAVGYGGPCFPRDNLALGALAESLGVAANLAEATDKANRKEVVHLANVIEKRMEPGQRVAILGISYKPDTNVIEESQGLLLARYLAARNVDLLVFDPAAMQNARFNLPDSVAFPDTLADCVLAADVIVITTPWKEFLQIPQLLGNDKRRRLLIDCWRLLTGTISNRHVDYLPLGVGYDDSDPVERV